MERVTLVCHQIEEFEPKHLAISMDKQIITGEPTKDYCPSTLLNGLLVELNLRSYTREVSVAKYEIVVIIDAWTPSEVIPYLLLPGFWCSLA